MDSVISSRLHTTYATLTDLKYWWLKFLGRNAGSIGFSIFVLDANHGTLAFGGTTHVSCVPAVLEGISVVILLVLCCRCYPVSLVCLL